MASPIPEKLYTPEEYLEFERKSDVKHEWLDGRIYVHPIYLMAGGSPSHSKIIFNVTGILFPQLRGTKCAGYNNDLKVRSGKMQRKKGLVGLFSYPDLTVVCGEAEFHDKEKDVLINPTVIIEVLSPNTEDFDRGTKFVRYQINESLTDYIVIAQDEPRIEHHQRKRNNQWVQTVYTGLRETAVISSIGCKLKLSDVYDRVTFEANKAS
jgi:Uma2 family endonuclease